MNTEKSRNLDLATISGADLVKAAENQAKQLKRVKTHQLRNIFGAIKKIQTSYQQNKESKEQAFASVEMELVMLKPKLAYAAGRQREVKNSLYRFMIGAIDSVLDAPAGQAQDKALKNFFFLMESLIAYHKYYGG